MLCRRSPNKNYLSAGLKNTRLHIRCALLITPVLQLCQTCLNKQKPQKNPSVVPCERNLMDCARAPQASQLGVYRAFVDNYKVAVETADKCCQANAQFAEISEVCTHVTHDAAATGTSSERTVGLTVSSNKAPHNCADCLCLHWRVVAELMRYFCHSLCQNLKVKSTKDCKDHSAKYSLESE